MAKKPTKRSSRKPAPKPKQKSPVKAKPKVKLKRTPLTKRPVPKTIPGKDGVSEKDASIDYFTGGKIKLKDGSYFNEQVHKPASYNRKKLNTIKNKTKKK